MIDTQIAADQIAEVHSGSECGEAVLLELVIISVHALSCVYHDLAQQTGSDRFQLKLI